MLELTVAQKVGRWRGKQNKTTKAMQNIYSSSFLKLELGIRVVVEHKQQHLLAKGLSRLRKMKSQ